MTPDPPRAVLPDPETHVHGAPAQAAPPAAAPAPAVGRDRRRLWVRLVLFALLAGAAAGVALHRPTRERLRLAAASLLPQGEGHGHDEPAAPTARGPATWDGLVELTPEQAEAIGLETAVVRPQEEPTRLEINGTTAYDPNTQIQVRPRFTSVIDRVYVSLGQSVKAGDPLVDLFSAELAAAKSEYEKAQARWEHDKRELARAEKLFHDRPPAISEKEYLSIANDEKLSRAEAKVAADKLLVYGVGPAELVHVPDEIGTDKAKMTLRAPASGVVLRKDVVKGNRYDDNEVLLVIAPLDHFWVWGHVYPSDATKVAIGQRWVVRSPLLEREIPGVIESITSDIDRATRTLRIRTQIPNVDGRMKADLLVGGYVEIPPSPGRMVVPRMAMVSADGADYVFVEHPASGDDPATRRFARRRVRPLEESHDRVLVGEGVREGDRVATRGSLILAQIYEDDATVEAEAPLADASP